MKPVRFAILGTARIARTVGPRIQAVEGAELAGVASRSAESASAFASDLNIPKTYDSYEAALNDPDIDAVYIPLPPALHLEWVTRAAQAGKHILCEKPLAMNVSEVRDMIAICRKHGVVLLDGVMWYHTPRATEIKRIVDSGQLGELRQLNSVFTFCWDEFPLDNVRMQRELGGGSLMDLGWYCVGVALWLFDAVPVRVIARADYRNDVDTQFNGWLEFSDGRIASIECGFNTVKRRWVEVAGTTQNLVCDDFTRPWNADKPRFWTHDSNGNANEHVIHQRPQEEHMIDTFGDLVRNDTINHPWMALSQNTQLVCDALDHAARERSSVDIEVVAP